MSKQHKMHSVIWRGLCEKLAFPHQNFSLLLCQTAAINFVFFWLKLCLCCVSVFTDVGELHLFYYLEKNMC